MKLGVFGIVAAAILAFHLSRAHSAVPVAAKPHDDHGKPRQSEHPRAEVAAAPGMPTIRIDTDGWAGADRSTIEQVLRAVVVELLSRFPGRKPLAAIRVSRSAGLPMTFFDRGPDAEYRIALSASGNEPGPYIYEFAHEFCHVLANYERHRHRAVTRSQQWFEEALCEVASLYTLKALASQWQVAAPNPRLAAAAPGLVEIARRFQQEAHRGLPPGTTLAVWYARSGKLLGGSAYDRERNEVVANLLLPLFEENPDLWGAIEFLNLDAPGGTFRQYLQSWLDNAPPRYRDVIRYTMSLFFNREPVEVAGSVEFPSRPLQFIVTFGPGGGADGMARKLAELLEPLLGMPVLVENVPGAAGNAGLTKLLLSGDPDHTIATLTALTAAAWAEGVGTIDAADFSIVGVVQETPSMLFVAAESPLQDFARFLEAAREQRLRVATSGRGTLDDLTIGLLGNAGYRLLNSPFANPHDRYRAVLDGRADALFEEPGDVVELLASGRLRPLVTFAEQRHPSFPTVPVAGEFGLAIDDMPNFRSLAVSSRVASDRVDRLARALDAALGSDEWQRYCARTFSCTVTGNPAEAKARVRALIERVERHRASLPR